MNATYRSKDIELFREIDGDYNSPSVFLTHDRNIGINVEGSVFVMSLSEWHKRASEYIKRI